MTAIKIVVREYLDSKFPWLKLNEFRKKHDFLEWTARS